MPKLGERRKKMGKYGKRFFITWGIVIFLAVMVFLPVAYGGTRIYQVDIPSSYSKTPMREQDALAKDFLEGKVTEIEDTKTFVALEPEFSYLHLKVEEKSVEIQYLGRVQEGTPTVIHTLKKIGWGRSYKIVGEPKVEGTNLVVEVERDFGDFVGSMILIGGLLGAIIGGVVCLYIAVFTEN